MSQTSGRLCVWGFGLALGITQALGIFILGLIAWLYHYGTTLVVAIGDVYIGYKPTLIGSLYGALWGFVDLFIAGIVIAWIYNFICSHCCKGS